jgi:orotidine-5'-phosphate decarboxylase
MMKAARDAALSVSAKKRPLILGVTVLTSMNESVLRGELGVSRKLPKQVTELARLAHKAGLNGVVCSALEVKNIKKTCTSRFIAVTPGIRPLWAAQNDQARIVTPKQAFALGADYIVIGRPITYHTNPAQAVQMILRELQ